MEKKKRVKCQNCGYEWDTKSSRKYVSCPNCLYKVNVEKRVILHPMRHFNLSEDGVKILDETLNWIVDVQFKRNKAWCLYDKSSNCRHIKFALGLPEVQKILKKKGWDIDRLTR